MRVLIPVHAFLPASQFGAELYTYYLARELSKSENVHLFFPELQDTEQHERIYDGLPCTVVKRAGHVRAQTLDSGHHGIEAAFQTLLNEFRPDVVHFNHLLHLSPRLPFLARTAGARTVYTLHDYWLRCPAVKLLDRWGHRCTETTAWKCASCARSRFSSMWWPALDSIEGQAAPVRQLVKELVFQIRERPAAAARINHRQTEMRALLPAVDQFIAPTAFMRDRMVEWGIKPQQVMVCDYGTKPLPYAPRQPQAGRLRFGYIGGATRQKGLHVLLSAFRGFMEADLIIFGATRESLTATFGEFVDVLAQRNVTIGGFIDDPVKATAIPALDALIVASVWYENSPLVIHEAFQAGVPVVCSNIGGMAELVSDGVDGLHFEVGSATSLRAVLTRCVDNPALLEALAQRIETPKGFEAHVADELLPLYHTLCAKPQ